MTSYAVFDKTAQLITFSNPLLMNNNIGIGTTTPNYKLDVVGNLKVTNNCSVSRLVRNDKQRPYIRYTDPSVTGGIIDYATMVYDTHNAVTTGATWKFTTPIGCSGYYLISAALHPTVAAFISIFKNGTQVIRLAQTASAGGVINGSFTLYLNENDYIDIRSSTASINATALYNWISISCLELV